jgi:hypothetical protein
VANRMIAMSFAAAAGLIKEQTIRLEAGVVE